MKGKQSDRRRFLKDGAALAGMAMGGMQFASGQAPTGSGMAEGLRHEQILPYGVPSRLETTKRNWWSQGRYSLSAVAKTPLQDLRGIITPSALHFVIFHGNAPDFDPQQHRLLIQGLVDRPLIFSLDELKRLPSVSRICFIECGGNGTYTLSAGGFAEEGGQGVPRTAQEAFGSTSCSEWTGVPLSLLLREAGVKGGASWLVAEGADGGWTISIPLKMSEEFFVAYAQNGEAVRPEQGHPLRLVTPGFPGDHNVKCLRRIYLAEQPHMSLRDHSGAARRADGKSRLFRPQMPAKSLITFPSGGHRLPGPGFYEIIGLAWSGGGRVRRVEVSTDGGRSWKDARLQEPVLPKAHTRFCMDWNWDGEEAVLQSRCTDERGEVQPTIAAMAELWGTTPAQWKATRATPSLFNPIQPWKVTRDGSVHNVLF